MPPTGRMSSRKAPSSAVTFFPYLDITQIVNCEHPFLDSPINAYISIAFALLIISIPNFVLYLLSTFSTKSGSIAL